MLFLIGKAGDNTFSTGDSDIYIAITGALCYYIYTALFNMLNFNTKNNIINSFRQK